MIHDSDLNFVGVDLTRGVLPCPYPVRDMPPISITMFTYAVLIIQRIVLLQLSVNNVIGKFCVLFLIEFAEVIVDYSPYLHLICLQLLFIQKPILLI